MRTDKRSLIRIFIFAAVLVLFALIVPTASGLNGDGGRSILFGVTCAEAADKKPSPTLTPTPTPRPTYPVLLIADYTGPNLAVGSKVSTDDLTVVVYYSNGADEELDSDTYILTDDKIKTVGDNKFTVVFKDLTASFTVTGKQVESLYAINTRQQIYMGNMPDERDLTVSVIYTDGSSELIESGYTVLPEKFTELGTQSMLIQYKGASADVGITVLEAPALETITVTCDGKSIMSDSKIKKSQLTVYGIYADGTAERLTTYTIDTPSIHDIGKGIVRVSYQGKTAEVEVTVVEKTIASIRAEYLGGLIEVYREFDYNDLRVYLVFEDGTEERTEDYVVYQRMVKYIGENSIKVYAKSMTTTFTVKGIEPQKPTFDYVSLFTIEKDDLSFDVATAIPAFIPESGVTGKLVKNSKIKKIIRRIGVNDTGQYIGFSYSFENEDDETELPLDVRISLPEGFEAQYTELYYSPNLTSIVAKMNKTDIDDTTIESTLFRAGTYVLVYDPEAYIVEEYDEDEDDEDEEEED